MTQTHHSSCDPDGDVAAPHQTVSTESTPTSCSQSSASWLKRWSNGAEVMRSAVLERFSAPAPPSWKSPRVRNCWPTCRADAGSDDPDMLFLQLRHAAETEAVNASERAEATPRCRGREVAAAFADPSDLPAWEKSFRQKTWKRCPTAGGPGAAPP